MRCAVVAFLGFALAGSPALAQPVDGRLKTVLDTATLRIAYRTDSRPFSFIDAQGRPTGYTIDLCLHIARSLERELHVPLAIKWVPVDTATGSEPSSMEPPTWNADRPRSRCRACSSSTSRPSCSSTALAI